MIIKLKSLLEKIKIRLLFAFACFIAAGALLAFTFFNFSLNFQLKSSVAKLLGLPETLEERNGSI